MRTNQFKIFVVLLVCLVASPLFSETDPKVKAFVKKVEGGGRVIDAIQTTDGNYVSISSKGDSTYIVRKVTVSGKRIWEKSLSFEIPNDGFAFLRAIAQTNDGYVLVGWGRLSGYYSADSAIVVALDSEGTVKWNKRFDTGKISFHSVASRPDGGFIVTGGASPFPYHPVLVKFTSAGKILWTRGFEALSYAFLSQSTSDNGLILASGICSNCDIYGDGGHSAGAYVIRVDDSGNIVWKRTLKIKDFSLQALAPTSDNGVVLAGQSTDSNSLLLVGLNAKGKLAWKAKYSLNVPGFSISNLIQTPDGGYAATGATRIKSGATKGGFLLKIDARQNLVFQKTFGFRGVHENARSVFTTKEGGYILFGSSEQDGMLFLSLNSDGIVPGCGFFHHLDAKSVPFGALTIRRLAISPDPVAFSTEGPLELKSATSRKSSSSVCQ